MPHRVFAALVSRWDDQNLDNTFDGGIHLEETGGDPSTASNRPQFPYVTFQSLGETTNFWTSSSEFTSLRIQFDFWLREDESTDPATALGNKMETFETAMLFAPLSIPTANGHVLEMRVTRRDIRLDDDSERVWHGQQDYTVDRRRAATYSPA